MKIFLVAIAMLLLFGCATKPPAPVPVADVEDVEEVETAMRTPGSLWTEGSYVNGIYSSVSIHEPGDVIFVRPSRRLKNRIAYLAGDMPVAKDPNAPRTERAPSSMKKDVESAPNIIAATVKRKQGRGVLAIQGKRTVTVEGVKKELRIRGKIREKDLDAKDFVSSDVIFDLKVNFAQKDKNKKKSKRS